MICLYVCTVMGIALAYRLASDSDSDFDATRKGRRSRPSVVILAGCLWARERDRKRRKLVLLISSLSPERKSGCCNEGT